MRSYLRIAVGLLTGALFSCSTAFSAPLSYSFQTLDVPGAIATQALGINDLGQVVGFFSANDTHHGFMWSMNAGYNFIDMPGSPLTEAFDIDNTERVVGVTSGFPGGSSFLLNGASFSVFAGNATGLNNVGAIVGFEGTHGFLRIGALSQEVRVPGASSTRAYGINDGGQVVGSYIDGNGEHGYVKSGDQYFTVDFPGAHSTDVRDINNVPQIVGSFQDSNRNFHGFVSRGLELDPLDVPGATNTVAEGVNSRHQVVGFYTDAEGFHGFIATPSVPEPSLFALLAIALLAWRVASATSAKTRDSRS